MWRSLLALCLLLCGCTASAQSRPTVTPVNPHPTPQLDPGVIVWPFPLTPVPAYPAPLQAQPTGATLTATLTPQGVAVTWSAPEPVCPWLESGAVRAYAGGAAPCRASGAALVSLVPDLPARVVLRTPEGREVAGADVVSGYQMILPLVVRP